MKKTLYEKVKGLLHYEGQATAKYGMSDNTL